MSSPASKPPTKPEDLVGRLVICVANLKPRQMKFGLSQGMICASGARRNRSVPAAPTPVPFPDIACTEDQGDLTARCVFPLAASREISRPRTDWPLITDLAPGKRGRGSGVTWNGTLESQRADRKKRTAQGLGLESPSSRNHTTPARRVRAAVSPRQTLCDFPSRLRGFA
ncbi:MAG UNVERIFIED_CONTAM: hypothetical protein LVR18_51030 [Planctomycetaceae bacterium]